MPIGRIGAYVGAPPEIVTVRTAWPDGRPVEGCWSSTWEVSTLTLRMIGQAW
jgi:regulator of sigma E protease